MAQSEHDHGLHAVAITDHVEEVSRRIGRTWAITAVLLFVVLGFTIGIPHGPDLEDWEKAAQLATLAILLGSTLLAWRWEGLGGSIMLVGATSLGVLAALQHQPVAAFLPALVFIVPAVAFLVAWNRTKSTISVLLLAGILIAILFTGSALANQMYQRGYGAAHPESALPPLPETPVVWIWSGAVTDTSATVVARIAEAEATSLTLIDSTGTTSIHHASPIGDVWRFEMEDLAPDTDYRYIANVDGVLVESRAGKFSTFPSGPTSFTIAAASCARLGSNGVVYETIAAAHPDLFIATGDLFYADYAETASHFTHAYESSLAQPAQAALYASVPIAYVWDDHDYGRNDSDATSPTRLMALSAYKTNVPHYDQVVTDAIYQSFGIGRVQVVLLDDRSQRVPGANQDGPDKTMLGAAQLAWLEDRLLDTDGAYALTIIVNQVPWITPPETGADHWGGYTHERQRISDFIADNDIDNILMVSGDAHMVAIDDGTNTDYSTTGNASFPLFQAAALDRPGGIKGGPYSEGAFAGGGQFGFIEITDTGGDTIGVHLKGVDWTGAIRVEMTYTADAP